MPTPRTPQLETRQRTRRTKTRRPTQPELITEHAALELGHTINGRKASGPEWEVYKALRSLGYDDEVQFQVSAFGGRRFIGGQVLDFVVRSGPTAAVIDVRGIYWHGAQASKSTRDRWREVQLAAMPDPPRVIVVWEDVATSPDRLRALLLKELGANR